MSVTGNNQCPDPNLVETGSIFNFIDVLESYDKGFAKDGWVRKLNENFTILEQLIFGGSGSGITINASSFSMNNLRAQVSAENTTDPDRTISVSQGLKAYLPDDSLSLFKFVCVSDDLTAAIGDPIAASTIGPGGFDNSPIPSSDAWLYYFVISPLTESDQPALVIGSDPGRAHLGPSFGNYELFRRLGSARYISSTGALLHAYNSDGETLYRDSHLFDDTAPDIVFSLENASNFVPPTTTRGKFVTEIREAGDDSSSTFYIGHPSLIGSSVNGKIVSIRGPADASGSSEYMVNEYEYETNDSQRVAYRREGKPPSVWNSYVVGYKETL